MSRPLHHQSGLVAIESAAKTELQQPRRQVPREGLNSVPSRQTWGLLTKKVTPTQGTRGKVNGAASCGATATVVPRQQTTVAIPQTSTTLYDKTTQKTLTTVNSTGNIPSTRITNAFSAIPPPPKRVIGLRQQTVYPRTTGMTIQVLDQTADQPGKITTKVVQQTETELEFYACVSPTSPYADMYSCTLSDSVLLHNSVFCPICCSNIVKEGRKTMTTLCGHLFCDLCLKQIAVTTARCPRCLKLIDLGECREIFIS